MKRLDVRKQYNPKLYVALEKGLLKGFNFNECFVPIKSNKYPAVTPYYWSMKSTSTGKRVPFYKRFFYASQSLCSLIVYYKSDSLTRAKLGTGMVVSPPKSNSNTFVVSSANCTQPTIVEEGKTFHLNKIKVQISGLVLDVNGELLTCKEVYRGNDKHNFSILKFKSTEQSSIGLSKAFFIPSPVKEVIPCSKTSEYNHLLMAMHTRISEENVKNQDHEFLNSIDKNQMGVACLLGEDNACCSFGEVMSVDEDALSCKHSSCTVQGSSGGASLILNPFDLDSEVLGTDPPFETPLFSGIQLGGSSSGNQANVSYVVDNDEFKQQYAKYVIDKLTSEDWEDLDSAQKAAIKLFLGK